MATTGVQSASTLGTEPSFGFGDRLGTATPGHLDALLKDGQGIRAIFAQQSIREMNRTQRTPNQVMAAARDALERAGFSEMWGADADHLKTTDDVDVTAEQGFVFFTIDPSDFVDNEADGYESGPLRSIFERIQSKTPWIDQYLGKTISVPNGPQIEFDELTVWRAAVKYGAAIAHSLKIAEHIKLVSNSRGTDQEIEISVDETPQPTTLAEHYIIADQLVKAGINLVSLAPRFIGEFEKGVDFKGDLAELELSLEQHAAIARHLGPYKLSLHSGSDKLSIYGLLARATNGLFHVKTAGTSYLEALRVVARHDEPLFRRIIDFARQRYDVDRATYHVSATVETVAPPEELADLKQLEQTYLECWEDVKEGKGFTKPGRQILHCTFGSVLTDPELGAAVKQILDNNPETHCEILSEHFRRHLRALRSGMTED